MKIKKGFETEYKKRHDQIWPELSDLLSSQGIKDYSIFLDEETSILFAVQKIHEDYDINYLKNHPIVIKWWDYMADIMETNSDKSPKEKELIEMFHLD